MWQEWIFTEKCPKISFLARVEKIAPKKEEKFDFLNGIFLHVKNKPFKVWCFSMSNTLHNTVVIVVTWWSTLKGLSLQRLSCPLKRSFFSICDKRVGRHRSRKLKCISSVEMSLISLESIIENFGQKYVYIKRLFEVQ